MTGFKGARGSGQEDCECEEDVFGTLESEIGLSPLRVGEDHEKALQETTDLIGSCLGGSAGKRGNY